MITVFSDAGHTVDGQGGEGYRWKLLLPAIVYMTTRRHIRYSSHHIHHRQKLQKRILFTLKSSKAVGLKIRSQRYSTSPFSCMAHSKKWHEESICRLAWFPFFLFLLCCNNQKTGRIQLFCSKKAQYAAIYGGSTDGLPALGGEGGPNNEQYL
jgi:hypothetical protein